MKTYGTLKRGRNSWVVVCAPHVSTVLKRIFGKIDKHAHDKLTVSDTLDSSMDLHWFMQRYPLEMSDEDRAHLENRASQYRERTSIVEALLGRHVAPPAFEMALPPRDYQRVAGALNLAVEGLLNADELGVGKTVSALCILTDTRTLPSVVVAPTHLKKQWGDEIARFLPHLRVHRIKKGTPYDVTLSNGRGKQLKLPAPFPDVFVTTYHMLRGWVETLARLGVNSVIFDEVQALRHGPLGLPGEKVSQLARSAKFLAQRVQFRTGLSATPIHNYGDEFWSVIDVLRPGALGTYEEFKREHCTATYGGKVAIRDPKAFGAFLREAGLMIRRTRSEVGQELPPLQIIPHHIDADTNALERVSTSCAELARLILQEGQESKGEKMRASADFDMKLRQATGIAKAPYVAQFVRMLVESGERVLLGGWHREVYSIWLDLLKDLNPVMFTGSESPNQKEAAKQAFIAGATNVMIMSLRAGSGTDGLQKVCRTVVKGELDWSPAVHEQFVGRVFRDGQSDPVVAYYLLADYGSDPVISDVLGVKRGQSHPVLNPDQALIERSQIDPQHIKKLAAAYLGLKQTPPPLLTQEIYGTGSKQDTTRAS